MLDTLIIEKTIRCVDQDRDRYGRLVVACFARALHLHASMVEDGWALADRQDRAAYVRQGVIGRPRGGMDAEVAGIDTALEEVGVAMFNSPTPSQLGDSQSCSGEAMLSGWVFVPVPSWWRPARFQTGCASSCIQPSRCAERERIRSKGVGFPSNPKRSGNVPKAGDTQRHDKYGRET
jgi:hypothetical protein